MSQTQGRRSIPPPRQPLTAPPGPFDGIKLRLVLLLLGGVAAGAVLTRLAPPAWVQLAMLAAYGISGTIWAVTRIRRIVGDGRNGPQ